MAALARSQLKSGATPTRSECTKYLGLLWAVGSCASEVLFYYSRLRLLSNPIKNSVGVRQLPSDLLWPPLQSPCRNLSSERYIVLMLVRG